MSRKLLHSSRVKEITPALSDPHFQIVSPEFGKQLRDTFLEEKKDFDSLGVPQHLRILILKVDLEDWRDGSVIKYLSSSMGN